MLLRKLLNLLLGFFISAFVFTAISVVGAYAVFPCQYKKHVLAVCSYTQVEPELIFAIIKTESSFKADKISNKGAIGLMQIMPDTATYVSELYFGGRKIDLFNPEENILVGVTYLVYLFDRFENKKTALSAYNAGEGNVKNWLNDRNLSKDGVTLTSIPFKETSDYIDKVVKRIQIYKRLYKFKT